MPVSKSKLKFGQQDTSDSNGCKDKEKIVNNLIGSGFFCFFLANTYVMQISHQNNDRTLYGCTFPK